MTPITRKEILSTRLLSNKARLWAYDLHNLEYLNKPMRLFGSSQKVEKGSDKRSTYILYLQPAGKVARGTLCPAAAASGCESPCLISSGQLGMSTGQRAATKRTILMLLRPHDFMKQLLSEIDRAERKAVRDGVPALFRLNGTSDIDFSPIIAQRPESDFYDYTKILSRVRKNTLPNYHLTFSGSMYSEASRRALRKAMERGDNIAMAVNTKLLATDGPALANIIAHFPSFDETDIRPLDQRGTLGLLTRKGSNKAERAAEDEKVNSFFITESNWASFYTTAILAGRD